MGNVAARTVALDPEAYQLLRDRKRPTETFSDVVKRITRPRRPLSDFVGIWEDDSRLESVRFDKIRRALRRDDLAKMSSRSKELRAR